MTGGGLFDGVLTRGPVSALVDDWAWVRAMLAAETALVEAQAEVGLVPPEVAETVRRSWQPQPPDGASGPIEPAAGPGPDLAFDPAALGADATGAGNPAVPLVRALTERVRDAAGSEAAGWVHAGATSQDVLDTAAVLITKAALGAIERDLRGAADAAAALAAAHRSTPVAARTLLQQALPTTFGLKAAGWLVALDDAADAVAGAAGALPAQLGGAAGTLAALGPSALDVVAAYARLLELREPVLPWHTNRLPIVNGLLPAAAAAGVVGKVALDIVLLAQTEVAEVAEVAPGRGGSSTLPHKQNPVAAIAARAAAAQAPGLASTLLGAMAQEHERAAGAWHAEWRPQRQLLLVVGAAASWLAESLRSLEVDPDAMRANLDRTGGLLLAEHVTTALRPALGRSAAHDLVERASRDALRSRRPLLDVLLAAPAVAEVLDEGRLRQLLDPTTYLGSAGVLVDRALARHASGRGR